MKKEDILLHMNEIDDTYIKEAADFKPEKQHMQRKHMQRKRMQKKWIGYGSLAAACLLICVLGAVQLLPSFEQDGKKPLGESDSNTATRSEEHTSELQSQR